MTEVDLIMFLSYIFLKPVLLIFQLKFETINQTIFFYFIGYLNNEEATMSTIDKDGWLHTGDIVYFDQDGYLYLCDRLKDMIKYKGFQV
jgi:hypothetical protein